MINNAFKAPVFCQNFLYRSLEPHIDLIQAQFLMKQTGHFPIQRSHDLGSELNQRNLQTTMPECLCHFEPDKTAPDNQCPTGLPGV